MAGLLDVPAATPCNKPAAVRLQAAEQEKLSRRHAPPTTLDFGVAGAMWIVPADSEGRFRQRTVYSLLAAVIAACTAPGKAARHRGLIR